MTQMCEWPVDYAGCTGCDDFSQLSEGDQEKFELMAGEFLWNWTNRVFGTCSVTLRPCTRGCEGWSRWASTFWGRGPFPWASSTQAPFTGAWGPVLLAGEWYNIGCGCVGTCRCEIEGPTSLALPGPVQSITQVRVDGEVVPPESYDVKFSRMLVRTDGETWPTCQDVLAAPTEEDTFEVIYQRGVPVPMGGQIAAGILASEFAKAACNDKSCQLPRRIQTITRQDVSVTLMDNFADLQKGGTGIWLIDSWVQSVLAPRPYSSVRSVDIKPKAAVYGY